MALHVNHMAQNDSNIWEKHCEDAAAGIKFEAHQKQVDVVRGLRLQLAS